jgi:hypothetical protein
MVNRQVKRGREMARIRLRLCKCFTSLTDIRPAGSHSPSPHKRARRSSETQGGMPRPQSGQSSGNEHRDYGNDNGGSTVNSNAHSQKEVPVSASTSLPTAPPHSIATPQPVDLRGPPTPVTQRHSSDEPRDAHDPGEASSSHTDSKTEITNSAAVPLEHPIKLGARTLRAHLALVRNSLPKHDTSNWIAHSCVIAMNLDEARRALQADLYATDEAFLTGRDLEKELAKRGFTHARAEVFIVKVLSVLDGIAMADGDAAEGEAVEEDANVLEGELQAALEKYPQETKEALTTAGRLMEYLSRGKELQEKKRLEVERRVKVLEGMVKIGEVVGGVVRYLLTEDK